MVTEVSAPIPFTDNVEDNKLNVLVETPHDSFVQQSKEINDEPQTTIGCRCWTWIKSYANKFRGLHQKRPKRIPWHEYLWSFVGALLGMALVSFIHYHVVERQQLVFLIGSFGASAVLVFAMPSSPVAQPRNLIGGHLIGAVCGCIVRAALEQYERATACALAVALAIVVMQLTETLHPPGGATALLAVTTNPALPWAHFSFILMPALTGACAMLLVALITNNLAPTRTYPIFWW